MERVAGIVKAIEPHDSVERYTGLGVDVVEGTATIIDPWHVKIVRANGGEQILSTRSIVVATGARPFVPPLPGLEDVGYLTSDTLWGLRELPARLVVLGGGPIGCELAQAFARLGAAVTQVEMAPRIMLREDEEVSAFARKASRSTAWPRSLAAQAKRSATTSSSSSKLAGRKSASASTCCCAPSAAWRGCRASGWRNWASR
jgi:pyruvate/2-oxoglutarate dehydrogenase complex dihydrolipoamide dehydrogenase (E3) component